MVFLFHSWYVMLGFVKNMKIFCSEDPFWFQSYWSRDSLHGNYLSKIIWSSYRHCSQIWHFCVTYVEWFVHQLWHMTGFQLFLVNRDGCHMWGRKCSLFPEHLVSLPLGRSWSHPFITYTLHNLSVYRQCLGINDYGLFAWISLTALSWTYFIIHKGRRTIFVMHLLHAKSKTKV